MEAARIIPQLTQRQVDRFYDNVMVTDTCHVWTGYCDPRGYGRMGVREDGKNKPFLAHRIAYKLATGVDPSAHVVRHKCDNPTCVAPYHLELGTQADNMRDAAERGRIDIAGQRSIQHRRGLGRFTEAGIRHIRSLIADGKSLSEIGEIFGVEPQQISNIKLGRKWGWVE